MFQRARSAVQFSRYNFRKTDLKFQSNHGMSKPFTKQHYQMTSPKQLQPQSERAASKSIRNSLGNQESVPKYEDLSKRKSTMNKLVNSFF